MKDAPARLTVASAKATEVANDVAGKVADVAESVQSKIALGQLDPKALRERISEPDLRAAREKAQSLLLAQVGRALEVAGKAVETYDEYSERGKVVVDRVLAGRGGADVETVSVEDVKGSGGRVVVDEITVVETVETVVPEAVVEQVVVAPEAPKAEAKPEAKTETKVETKTVKVEPKPAAKKPAAARRTANARKRDGQA